MTGPDAPPGESVAVALVTFNRAELLGRSLDGLAAQTRRPDAVFVVDNASTDNTAEVLAAHGDLPITVITMGENTGGAGGFHTGLKAAYDAGFDRIWLLDDDVVPAVDCLEVLMGHDEDCLTVVREDLAGRMVEKAAMHFDLRNPAHIKPKTQTVDEAYPSREAMPALVPVENVAFEGFLIRRRVVEAIGLPHADFFIFYDDCDYAIRAREAGFTIWAVRDAVMVRQLDFDQQHALDSWKGFYMYRNLFVVHLRHGENAAVRAKPWVITAGVVVLAPLRGGRGEARNVIRAMRSAWGMRKSAAASVD